MTPEWSYGSEQARQGVCWGFTGSRCVALSGVPDNVWRLCSISWLYAILTLSPSFGHGPSPPLGSVHCRLYRSTGAQAPIHKQYLFSPENRSMLKFPERPRYNGTIGRSAMRHSHRSAQSYPTHKKHTLFALCWVSVYNFYNYTKYSELFNRLIAWQRAALRSPS